jgi:hypothetical protein
MWEGHDFEAGTRHTHYILRILINLIKNNKNIDKINVGKMTTSIRLIAHYFSPHPRRRSIPE